MKAFEDTSIFQGWMEFCDYNGVEYRIENKSSGFYLIYRRLSDGYMLIKIEDTHLIADRFYMHEGTGSVAMGKEWLQDFLDMRDEEQSFDDWEGGVLIEVEFVNGEWREVK